MSRTLLASWKPAVRCHTRELLLARPPSRLSHSLNRFPWCISRVVDRHIRDRLDHRSASVMAQAEASVRAQRHLNSICIDFTSYEPRSLQHGQRHAGAVRPQQWHRNCHLEQVRCTTNHWKLLQCQAFGKFGSNPCTGFAGRTPSIP